MYLKVLRGKVNYKNNIYKTDEMFECRKDIGSKLIKSKLCVEVNEELFKVLSKQNISIDSNMDDEINIQINKESKTIDDLRDAL